MEDRRLHFVLTLMTPALIAVLLIALGNASGAATDGVAQEQDEIQPSDDQGLADPAALMLELESYTSGLNQPVGLASAGDLRLFVVERAGRIKIIENGGAVRSTPFLDIRDRVNASESEMGLLGLAFHPRYHENGLFYVNYTSTSGGERRTRISSFNVSADPNMADAGSEQILLTVDQPYWNHNAGKIIFGPDGYLYIPLGDGGYGGDPEDNAQNSGLLLGKISRIDVDGGQGSPADCQGFGSGAYTVPAGNPHVDGPGASCDEIWASGLRNPWQSSFDRLTGDLFVADVGQRTVEEVNFKAAGSAGGENYGWRCYEGSLAYNLAECGPADSYVFPIFEYERPTGFGDCSVTGGYVYRGRIYPSMVGRYFLTDYCSGRFWDLLRLENGAWQATAHSDVFLPGAGALQSGNAAFGQRCDGELFMTNIARGQVYHLISSGSPDIPDNLEEAARLEEVTPKAYVPFLATSGCR